MCDPDAPTGSGWWHWSIFDIPINIKSLKRHVASLSKFLVPKGSIQSIINLGMAGFGGACPPRGDNHH